MKHKYVAVFQLILCNRFNILRNLITTEQTVIVLYIFTGSIARSANLPVFSLLRGQF